MITTILWIVWIAAFAVLEALGLRDPKDGRFTLTNRIRAVMRASPVARQVARMSITVGLSWLAYHFLGVDPSVNPGS